MSWWFRLRRLWGQDRIRLSPRDVRSPHVQVGDHLEIYGQLWTVEADLSGHLEGRRAGEAAYRLVHHGGPVRRVVLRRMGPPREAPWILEDEAGGRRVCWRDVIQYAMRPGLPPDVV